MVRGKLIAGLAALTAAGSIAIPVASASAQPAATAGARSAAISFGPPFGPPGEFQSPFCLALVRQIQFATATGHLLWASALGQVFVYSHCGGAAL